VSSDLWGVLGRLKSAGDIGRLRRRPGEALTFVRADTPSAGPPLLLDTCVYIDVAADRMPDIVLTLLRTRLLYHSSVCLAELAYSLGALDPGHPGTARNRRVIEDIIARAEADGRTESPDTETWLAAGVLAGILARTQHYDRAQRRKALADSLVLATALHLDLIVLTADLTEFDLLQQLIPESGVLFYRTGT